MCTNKNGQTFYRSKWDQLYFLQERAGLVKLFKEVKGIGQNCWETAGDWSNFLLSVRVIRFPVGFGRIGEASSKSDWD